MDVIALDRAGIAEVVAPNGTAVTEAQLERMWRLDRQPICCFDGDAAGQKAAVRAALRALPHLGPERTLRFVALPAGPGPRRCRQHRRPRRRRGAARQRPSRWSSGCGGTRCEAAPLDTPEARAGLKQRLMEHAAGDRRSRRPPALPRRMAATLRRAGPAAAQQRPLAHRRRREWKKQAAASPAAAAPTSADAAERAVGAAGIDAPTAARAARRLRPSIPRR